MAADLGFIRVTSKKMFGVFLLLTQPLGFWAFDDDVDDDDDDDECMARKVTMTMSAWLGRLRKVTEGYNIAF